MRSPQEKLQAAVESTFSLCMGVRSLLFFCLASGLFTVCTQHDFSLRRDRVRKRAPARRHAEALASHAVAIFTYTVGADATHHQLPSLRSLAYSLMRFLSRLLFFFLNPHTFVWSRTHSHLFAFFSLQPPSPTPPCCTTLLLFDVLYASISLLHHFFFVFPPSLWLFPPAVSLSLRFTPLFLLHPSSLSVAIFFLHRATTSQFLDTRKLLAQE